MVLIFSEDPGLDPHINTGIRRDMRWDSEEDFQYFFSRIVVQLV